MPVLPARPVAELVIKRPDNTVTRYVRTKASPVVNQSSTAATQDDEDARLVRECAPYTASFNTLLSEVRPREDARRLVSLVHDRMRNEGIPLNTKTYNLLMKRIVRFNNSFIFSLYEEIKADGVKKNSSVRPDLETYQLIFRACERGAQYDRAFRLYQQMRDLFKLIPETPTYNTLLGFCAAAHDVAQASYFIDEMTANSVPLDINTYNCYISTLVKCAPYEETLKVFDEVLQKGIQPTLRTYNTVLAASQLQDDYDRAFQLFEEMKRKGVLPDVITYNTLLWLCEQRVDFVLGRGKYSAKQRSLEQQARGKEAISNLITVLLKEMRSMEVSPNTFTFNKALAVLLKCEDPRIFLVYRQVMQAYPPKPTTVSLERHVEMTTEDRRPSNDRGNGGGGPRDSRRLVKEDTEKACHSLDAEKVHGYLESEMTSDGSSSTCRINASGVRPCVETYKIIVQACSALGHPEQCKSLYHTMKAFGVAPDREMFIIALGVCRQTHDREWGEELLTECRTNRLFIGTALLNAYAEVLAVTGSPELLPLFEQARRGIGEFGALVDTETYNAVLEGFLHSAHAEDGLALFNEIFAAAAKVTPNDRTYCLMIDLCAKANNTALPLHVVESCAVRRVSLGIAVFHKLLQFYANLNSEVVHDLFNRMKASANSHDDSDGSMDFFRPPDSKCYAILMQHYLVTQQYQRILDTFSALKADDHLELDGSTYTVMFHVYAHFSNYKAMAALLKEVQMKRIKRSIEMYETILQAFVKVDDSFVYEVLSDMKANLIPPADSTIAIFLTDAKGRRFLATALSRNLFHRPVAFEEL